MALQAGDYDNDINEFNGPFYVWITRVLFQARDYSKVRSAYQTD